MEKEIVKIEAVMTNRGIVIKTKLGEEAEIALGRNERLHDMTFVMSSTCRLLAQEIVKEINNK